jgi:hypothetical protein
MNNNDGKISFEINARYLLTETIFKFSKRENEIFKKAFPEKDSCYMKIYKITSTQLYHSENKEVSVIQAL